jgi:DNA-binding MarR family transcriptional regulator
LRSANKSSSPPEPVPFSESEFLAWRSFLRVHAYITQELDQRLSAAHELTLDQYGVLITLISAPDMRLRMGELGARRLITPSKITRVVDDLQRRGLVMRVSDPSDGRSHLATLTSRGLKKLREAQVTHHEVVRERFLGQLSEAQLRELARIWDAAVPGVVDADVWPPLDARPAPRR